MKPGGKALSGASGAWLSRLAAVGVPLLAILLRLPELLYQRTFRLLTGMVVAMRPAARAGETSASPDTAAGDGARGKSDVFFVIGSLQVGGAEMHLSRVTPGLVRRGYAVTVYNFSGLGPLGHDMAQRGVRVIGPPVPAHGFFPMKPVLLAVSAVKLYGILLFRRPGIAHFFLPQTYIIGAILARAAGLRRLVMSRRSLNYYQQRHPLLGRLERRLHRHMTVILANSRRVAAQLRDEERVPENKLGLIYNGVDTEPFETPFNGGRKRQALDLKASTRVLTIVANLIPYKGHADLLTALGGVREELPEDWRLLAVGRDDGIGKALMRQARELGIGERVEFLGPREDIADILRVSDLGILCSHEEGFSNAVLEAMAACLPMVVTDVGGNAEAVAHGKNGLVVPPHDPDALGAAILELMKDPERAARMGREGARRARELFSLESCVAQYDLIYGAVAESD